MRYVRNKHLVDFCTFCAHNILMKEKLNSFALLKWISENGDHTAKTYLAEQTGMTVSSINRALANKSTPRAEHRYRIYAVTGIILLKSDQFPEVEIKKMKAS